MDSAEASRFTRVLGFLDSVDGQLSNIRGRGPKAVAQAAARFKQQATIVPSWKPMTEALTKLGKAESAATKAVKDIYALADKKKIAALSLADAKKKARELMAKIQPVDDAVAAVIGLKLKIFEEIGIPTLNPDQNVELSVLVEKYCPMFMEYFGTFKLELNKLK